MMKATFKNVLSFEFWQKFGKALMVVIAVMPAAGLMISIGKSIVMIDPNLAPLVITGGILEQIGWGVIGNLHILFALAIGGSWAKERAGGAFAAGLAFILINRITGTIFGVTGDMLKNPEAMVTTFFGGSIKVADYFISVLEAPALNMGVFVGIISGFVGATAYNKYYNFRKLPDALSFFNGKRFVPFVVILRSTIAAIVLAAFWPVVQTGINSFGIWIANSQEWYLDCQLTRNCSNPCTILVWYFGTFALAIWSSPHVDYPNELHSSWWNIRSVNWCSKRNTSIWSRSALACMGN